MGKYQIIYADPPWSYQKEQFQSDGREFKNISKYYKTMSLGDLKQIPIDKITDENCVVFMWVTNSHLKFGIELIESWGFVYKTVAFVWLKRYGTGSICVNYAPWTLPSCELCLLGIKGKPKTSRKNIRQLIEAVRTEHSKKPTEARMRIVGLMGDLPRIELFARQQTPGWDVWGNEVDGSIKLDGKSFRKEEESQG